MTVTLAGYECLSPAQLREDCRTLGLPLDWWGKPNGFTCPLGPRPGSGWVLLRRGDLDALSPDGLFADLYDLAFSAGGSVGTAPAASVTVKQLLVTGAECLTPGGRGADAAYLVELADRRLLLRRSLAGVGYNLRQAATGAYQPNTLSFGQPWAWDQLLANLWARVPDAGGLGPWPGLPAGVTPDGTPEGLAYWDWPALDALADALRLAGCALRWDPLADVFGVVQAGAEDAQADAAFARWDAWRVWDGLPLAGVRARLPAAAQVLFRRVPWPRDQGDPFYSVTVPDPTPGDGPRAEEDGSSVTLHDDLAAQVAGDGTITNADACRARATARAADWFRRQWAVAGEPLRRAYALPLADPGLLPGAQVEAVRWADVGAGGPAGGMTTEVVRAGTQPDRTPADLQLQPDLPATLTAQGVNPTAGDFPLTLQFSTLEIDQGSGLTLADDGGAARVGLYAATGLHAGGVTITSQDWKGQKNFLSGLMVWADGALPLDPQPRAFQGDAVHLSLLCSGGALFTGNLYGSNNAWFNGQIIFGAAGSLGGAQIGSVLADDVGLLGVGFYGAGNFAGTGGFFSPSAGKAFLVANTGFSADNSVSTWNVIGGRNPDTGLLRQAAFAVNGVPGLTVTDNSAGGLHFAGGLFTGGSPAPPSSVDGGTF